MDPNPDGAAPEGPELAKMRKAMRVTQKLSLIHILTTFSDDEYIVSALKLGARGYLIKTDVAAIPPALAQVMDGKRVLEMCIRDRPYPAPHRCDLQWRDRDR